MPTRECLFLVLFFLCFQLTDSARHLQLVASSWNDKLGQTVTPTFLITCVHIFKMRQALLTDTSMLHCQFGRSAGCLQNRDVVEVLPIRLGVTRGSSLPGLFSCSSASLVNIQLVKRVRPVVL